MTISSKKLPDFFTLLEVVVAVAILAMAIAVVMDMAASSAKRSAKGLNSWKQRHILQQATEYYLLDGPEADIPDNFFPYDDYTPKCSVETPEIPSEMTAEKGRWRIVLMTVSIENEKAETVDSISFWKIIPKNRR